MSFKDLKKKWMSEGEIPSWYSTNSLQFFMNKYSYKGESVKSRDKAIAKYLAENSAQVYPDWWENDPYTAGKTYEEVYFNTIYTDGFAIPSTPLKANAGVPKRGMTVSCSRQYVENNIASKYLNNAETAIFTKLSHGCSVTVDDWLAEGDPIGEGDFSEGVIPIIEMIKNTTLEITHSTRRGQVAFYVGIDHGDFWKIAQMLYEDPDGLNIGWLIPDSFIEKLINKEKDAVARWNRMLYVRLAKGKGYLAMTDRMNRNKAQTFKNLGLHIKGSNLCVAPETMILTDRGYEIISDLEDQDVTVWNGKEWSSVKVVKTGVNQKLIKVTTSFNQVIECTPQHKFYVQVGSIGRGGKIYEKQAKDLKSGDRLIKFDLPIIEGVEELKDAYTNGFYSGDGCCFKGRQMNYLYHEKRNILDKLGAIHRVYEDDNQNRTVVTHDGSLKDKYFVPTANYTIDSRIKWLAGICDSDGTVSRNGDTESLQIGSIHLTFLQEIQMMLQTLGVTSTINTGVAEGYREMPLNNGTGENGLFYCQQAYRLLVNANGLFKLSELGFETFRLRWKKRRPNRECDRFMTIESVEDLGRYDDTFCFTEPKRHMGMFNGILTGQCNELNLPANADYSATCVIINANLALYDDFPEHLFHILHLMQDANVTGYLKQIESQKPHSRNLLSKAYNFTKDFRAVGTGTAGLHSLFMKKRIVFGSFESMLLNEEIFKRMQKDTNEANIWLADISGVPDGIKKAGLHLRNATTMFSPPTKSSAELARETPTEGNNLETALIKVKESAGGEIFRINYEFLKFMKEKGMYNKDEVARIAKNKGSVQDCDWMTAEEKGVFRIAFEIPMSAHIDLCSQRQRYFDQQQSINLYFSGSDTEEYIGEIHKQALLDEGINSLYYCYSSRGGRYTRVTECDVCQ